MACQSYIDDLERDKLKIAIPSEDDNRYDLRKEYLDSYGFDTWKEWADVISGNTNVNKKKALSQAYQTISTRKEFTNQFIDFLCGDGTTDGGGYDFLNNGELVQRLTDFVDDNAVDSRGTSSRDIQQGRCYVGDGVDDYTISGNLTPCSDNCEWEFWIKTPDVVSLEGIANMYDYQNNKRSWNIAVAGNETLSISLSSDGTAFETQVSTYILPINVWTKIRMEFSSGTLALYVNDVFEENIIFTTTSINNDAQPILLFARLNNNGVGNGLFGGELFGFKYTDSSTSEDLVFYKCDEQAGDIAYDSSGNQNDGTITNATLSTFHGTQNEYSFQNQVGYSNYIYSDGTGKIVIPALSIDSSEDWTIEFSCVLPETQSSSESICGLDASEFDSYLRFLVGGNVRLEMDGNLNYQINTTGLVLGTKYDIKLRFRNDDIEFYINDVLDKTTAITSDTFSPDVLFKGYTEGGFQGKMWDFKVTNNTSGEVTRLYELQEGSGDKALDTSGNDQHGDISGLDWVLVPRDESKVTQDVLNEPLQYSGLVKLNADLVDSNCIQGDGVDDYVTYDGTLLDNQATLSVGIKFNTGDVSTINVVDTLFAQNYEYLSLRGGGESGNNLAVIFRTDSGTASISRNVSFGDFEDHDAMLVYDGTELILYLDGVNIGSTTTNIGGLTDFGVDFLYLLTSRNFGTRHSQRKVWDFIATNRVLSESEMLDWRNGNNVDNILIRSPCAEGAGTVIYDVSGNENHGTASNITESTFWTTQDEFHQNITKGFSKRENLLEYSEDLTTASWTLVNNSGNASISPGNILHIELSSDQIQQKNVSLVTGQTYYFAVTMKRNSADSDNIRLLVYDGVSVIVSTSLNPTSDYQTFIVNGVSTQTGTASQFQIRGIDAQDTTIQILDTQVYTEADLPYVTTEDFIITKETYLPADSSAPTKDIFGNDLTNPKCTGHNNAETCIEQPLAPSLIQADEDIGYWYNHNDPVEAITRCYDDILLSQGSELIANPDFETDTSGWVAQSNTTLTRTTTNPITGTGSGLITLGGGSGNNRISESTGFSYTVGKKYKISCDVKPVSGDGYFRVSIERSNSPFTADVNEIRTGLTLGVVEHVEAEFIAQDTSYAKLYAAAAYGTTSSNVLMIDNVSIKELSEDNIISDQIFADTSEDPLCKTNILTYSTAQTGDRLATIKRYNNIS